jgi:hypothetical protein
MINFAANACDVVKIEDDCVGHEGHDDSGDDEGTSGVPFGDIRNGPDSLNIHH